MNHLKRTFAFGVTSLGLGLAIACGGNGGPTGPGGTGGGGGSGTSGATITIANGAVTPSEVTISAGQSVTFVNNDGRVHEMASDPHPNHSNCPAMNAVGTLQGGESRQTNAFTTAGTCGFHDHREASNNALRGQVIVR